MIKCNIAKIEPEHTSLVWARSDQWKQQVIIGMFNLKPHSELNHGGIVS